MHRRLLLVLLCGTQLIPLSAAPAPLTAELRLELRLTTRTPKVKAGGKAVWEVSIINRGRKSVTLVQPGDGSDCGWRTPIIEWAVDDLKGKEAVATHEAKTERKPRCLTEWAMHKARCGNINRLRENEVFDLVPGKEMKLNAWVAPPYLSGLALIFRWEEYIK